jgi:hypothetical protein
MFSAGGHIYLFIYILNTDFCDFDFVQLIFVSVLIIYRLNSRGGA